ncbi:hypothetical protein C7T94_00290 [Pedobacter yulinensis]|uniref:Carboxypeptidase-like regulatory domain-containing protein n=1 Tax=Pedobacter yulinensis TaxID=2126353 RepID=A0A2T3HQE4_9SPHI|nr:DUF5686 and carboxypeptidase regulatory-like domain-containing protein [Pedobacter yulinensis]PST84613.1 hypothetical protein C7T94_00290 [Pedobacter yulinensis]
MNKLYASILLFFICTNVSAQSFKLSGQIKDEKNDAVAFTSVYIKNTSTGTSANAEGHYQLPVSAGKHVVLFRAVGYKPLEKIVELSGDLTLSVTLVPEAFDLGSVSISANAEDPAYGIIRKAIRNRKKNRDELYEYSCSVYIKGVQKLVGAPKKFFGRDIQKVLELDTNRKGIIYQSESESKFNFRRPGQVREEMISSRVAGRNNAFSFNKASDLMLNFYDNILLENTLSARGFISPIAENALFYYRYKLLGTTEQNGETIHKIEVTPRRNNDPVFRGQIYIAEGSWRLYTTALFLTRSSGINLLDTLHIDQQFLKVEKTFVPGTVIYRFNGNIFGFKFAGNYVGVYSNYNIRPGFPRKWFNGEILHVTDTVNQKPAAYWDQRRPVPLTGEERLNYIRKDSLAKRKESKPYLDSVEQANNAFKLGKLGLTGYTIHNRFHKKSFSFDPVLPSLFYNTVEGFGMKYGITYRKTFDDRSSFNLRPELRYGLANRKFTGSLAAGYTYDPVKRAWVGLSFGSGIFDLNSFGSMSLLTNSFNSLVYETNYPKLYEKRFVDISTGRELLNGLFGSLRLSYARNNTLRNTADFTLIDYEDKQFSSNNPFTPDAESPLFPTYRSLNLHASLSYTFGQKYITRPDMKIYEAPKYPRIEISYRKGIKGVLKSEVDYDLISAEVSQERISSGMFGFTSFVVGAGKFLNNRALYYPEFKHFWGNNALIFPPNLRRFAYLDFYLFSTDREYFEAHAEHNFAGFFTNKVPLLRKLKLEEFVGASYLTQPLKHNYAEFYFGLQRLVFRASYGFAYDGRKKVAQGFRFSYGF